MLQVFGNVDRKKETYIGELQRLEIRVEGSIFLEDEILRKISIESKLEKGILMEETSWRQKSRALLLKGDKCTKFFYKVANSHQKNNAIESIEVDGAVFLDQSSIMDHICSFFEKLLMDQHDWRPKLDSLVPDTIDPMRAQLLENLLIRTKFLQR